jgi:glycerol-3-phosphate acyltransferase PlsY
VAIELLYLGLVWLFAGIPFGLVITTIAGGETDVRAAGSGNIGTTNVARLYGWRMAALVLALDLGKGLLPVAFGQVLRPDNGSGWDILLVLAAFLGHCFPIYLSFQGGKGVATGGGAMWALAPWPTTLAMGVWGAVLATTGRSSVASLAAVSALVPLLVWLAPSALPPALVLGVGVLLTHLGNVGRIVRGTEARVLQPVRWGRPASPQAEARELLDAPPSGAGVAPALWVPDGASLGGAADAPETAPGVERGGVL